MSDAKVSISRTNSNQRESDFISITIQDRSSGLLITRLEMELEDFASAITGQGSMPATFISLITPEMASVLGKVREVKTVSIARPNWSLTPEQVAEGIKPELIDGWTVKDDGTQSQQNDRDKHNVVLIRFVDAKEE